MCPHDLTETHFKGNIAEQFCLECCQVIDTMPLDAEPEPLLPATAEPPTDDER